MNTKYRKPITRIKDRYISIELDGDFTNNEMRHLLRKAYLNHKAPHEYDDVKKYIRDLVIGKHNSVYIMNNGLPEPLASASIFYPPAIPSGQVYYDYFATEYSSSYNASAAEPGFVNNGTCTSNTSGPASTTSMCTYGYDNGTALTWILLYTSNPFTSLRYAYVTTINNTEPGALAVTPITLYAVNYVKIKYGYALYQTSNNPLTLTTYYYWEAPSASFNYVYFNLCSNYSFSASFPYPGVTYYGYGNAGSSFALLPIFYSSGNYSFSANTYYLTMWQFTYT
jgi:hypothetical protein